MRARATRRLIGAAVLVVMAVVTLPMVFESQPRPLDTAIAIDLRKDPAALTVNPTPPNVAAAVRVPAPVASSQGGAAGEAIEVAASEPPRVVRGSQRPAIPASSATALAPVEPSMPSAERKPIGLVPDPAGDNARAERARVEPARVEQARIDRIERERAERVAKAAAEKAAAERAAAATRAALDKAASSKPVEPSARFLIQVGAFAETATVRETRLRIEKLGLRASEQDVETANGRRTRVRLGPFESRDDAEKVLARLRAAGLPGVVLVP